MFTLFKKKRQENFLHTDIHSHLIPNIDDGVKSWEESLSILANLQSLGINKVITTPHIMSDYYENTPEIIRSNLEILKSKIAKTEGLDIIIEAAAEYYVDERLYKYVEQGEELLSFGSNYILIETSFLNKPVLLLDLIFLLQSKGYKPILAHPERYIYLQEDYNLLDEIINTGTLLQVNINSFVGYYSPKAKNLAEHLVNQKLVNLLGSDIHNQKHLALYKKAIQTAHYQKCKQLNLINNLL